MNRAVLNRAVLDCAYVGAADVGGVGVMGALDEGEVQPYIKGHITDGSSTFTFKINNVDVTVPVDASGNWKWVVDRTITSLKHSFTNLTQLDEITFKNIKTTADCQQTFANCTGLKKIVLDKSLSDTTTLYGFLTGTSTGKTVILKGVTFSKAQSCWRAFIGCEEIVGLQTCTFEATTNCYQMFYAFYGETLDLSSAEFTDKITSTNMIFGALSATNVKAMKNINIKKIEVSISFSLYQNLTEQSIVNLFNAVAADSVVLTFHQNVWNMIMREIDVQGSPIQVAYQNMIDNYDVTIANASFDAEIEYLKGDGNAYIKTNDLFKINTTIKIIVTNSDVLHEYRHHIVGTFKGGARYRISTTDSNITTYYWYGASSSANVGDLSTTKTTYVITYNSLKKYQNNSIVKDLSFETEYVSNNVPISMFFCDESSDFYEHFLGEIYACQIYENDTLVRDFIPVRKGTTGYMYDKVSGNLFGNSGTGDFILGNDK